MGCSDDPGPTGAATADSTAAPSSTTSTTTTPACAPAADYTPGTTTHQLTVAGVNREFLVHLPPEPTADMPLVVDFHGAGSSMDEQAVYSGFDPLADAEGSSSRRPTASTPRCANGGSSGRRTTSTSPRRLSPTSSRTRVSTRAAPFATGISSGSAMSTSLACQASDTFHGFGLVAADFYIPPLCDTAAVHPIVIFHGTDDAVGALRRGPVLGGPTIVQPAEESAQRWATHNGCTAGPTETPLGSEVVRLDWTGCEQPVVMYRIVGGGHTWPGSIDVARLGMTTHQINATDEMWKVFSKR